MQPRENTCETIQTRIDEMSSKELKAIPAEVQTHLDTCPSCRAYLEQAYHLEEILEAWHVPSNKKNIATAVMADIAQAEHQQAHIMKPLSSRIWRIVTQPIPISIAALLVILLSLVGSIGLNVAQHQRLTDTRIELAMATQTNTQTKEQIVRVELPNSPQAIQPASHTTPTRSFFINPQNSPSPLVIILGAPPMVTLEPEIATEPLL